MNFDSDDYYYEKKWFVVKSDNKYSTFMKYQPIDIKSDIVRKNLNYFEALKFAKVLNKLYGK